MQSIAGKWALVTGSSRGIGRQIAIGLAQLGCNVIVHGRSALHVRETVEKLQAYDVRTHAVIADLACADGVRVLLEYLRQSDLTVDILYNNAGIQNEWRPLFEIDAQSWHRLFQVNVFSLIALTHALIPDMQRRGYGRIINLSSGIQATPQLAPYSVSKAAVDRYTRDLAAELQGSNVLVNCLDPGWCRTNLGGPQAEHEVETILPGALQPALLSDFSDSAYLYRAHL